MQNYTWCTDLHLDHLDQQALVAFAEQVKNSPSSGVILTGDISNAQQIVYDLSVFEKIVQKPIYYVCGNHDFYAGSIADTRKTLNELTNMSQYLKYMSAIPYVSLTPSTALVGHDGWYDAINGDWQIVKKSDFEMRDWTIIKEFAVNNVARKIALHKVVEVAREQAHQAVLHVQNGIKTAVRLHKNVVVATHVPPFEESHVYMGARGSKSMQPWYTSKMMGDLLMQASQAYPHIKFTVLCGHTHGKAHFKPAENLEVFTGAADYGHPAIADVILVA